ncbi:MAG: sigma-70 family RNA polymerase sigma factor [Candidatus Eisenbacteria bacterium]|nr:sigma-70 family RNA polymerase sigma factor [Candidatus Eisenbacteria bacterium]
MADRDADDQRSWITSAQRGDQDAFRRLVERHRDRAYGLARRILRSEADAEDVAQEAFVRVWQALPQFRGDAGFGTWLYRIVAHRSFDRLEQLKRRRERETTLDDASESAESVGGDDDAGRSRRLERLIADLSPPQRAAVTLYYYGDAPVEQVAETLDLPVNTVKTHLRRARAALREAWLRAERGGIKS